MHGTMSLKKTWKFVTIQISFPRVASTEDNSALNKLPPVRFEILAELPIPPAFLLISSGSIPYSDIYTLSR